MSVYKQKISRELAACCTAIRFLTVLPVTWHSEEDALHFERCVAYFPVIGLLIGLFGYFLATFTAFLFPQPVTSVVLVIYLSAISGFLHVDGLSDSGDGLLSARKRDVSLEIMKDSRVGAMGVVVIVAVFLMKFAGFLSVRSDELLMAVVFVPLAGRCAILFCMSRLKYARQEGGLGTLFYSDRVRCWARVYLLGFVVLSIFFAPYRGFFVLIAFFVVTLLFSTFCRARLGGATGDTLGAACEITEAVVVLAFTVQL